MTLRLAVPRRLRATVAIVATGLSASLLLSAQTSPFDIVIQGGRIVDGTGNPWFTADVGIKGDAIVAVARHLDAAGARSSMLVASWSLRGSSTSTRIRKHARTAKT